MAEEFGGSEHDEDFETAKDLFPPIAAFHEEDEIPDHDPIEDIIKENNRNFPEEFINEDVFLPSEKKNTPEAADNWGDPEIPMEVRVKAAQHILDEISKGGQDIELVYSATEYRSDEELDKKLDELSIGLSGDDKEKSNKFFKGLIKYAQSPMIKDHFEEHADRKVWEASVIDSARKPSGAVDAELAEATFQELNRNQLSINELVSLGISLGNGITAFQDDENMTTYLRNIQNKARHLSTDSYYRTQEEPWIHMEKKWEDSEEIAVLVDNLLIHNGLASHPETTGAEDRS